MLWHTAGPRSRSGSRRGFHLITSDPAQHCLFSKHISHIPMCSHHFSLSVSDSLSIFSSHSTSRTAHRFFPALDKSRSEAFDLKWPPSGRERLLSLTNCCNHFFFVFRVLLSAIKSVSFNVDSHIGGGGGNIWLSIKLENGEVDTMARSVRAFRNDVRYVSL